MFLASLWLGRRLICEIEGLGENGTKILLQLCCCFTADKLFDPPFLILVYLGARFRPSVMKIAGFRVRSCSASNVLCWLGQTALLLYSRQILMLCLGTLAY
jgi:hypothetical protein